MWTLCGQLTWLAVNLEGVGGRAAQDLLRHVRSRAKNTLSPLVGPSCPGTSNPPAERSKTKQKHTPPRSPWHQCQDGGTGVPLQPASPQWQWGPRKLAAPVQPESGEPVLGPRFWSYSGWLLGSDLAMSSQETPGFWTALPLSCWGTRLVPGACTFQKRPKTCYA